MSGEFMNKLLASNTQSSMVQNEYLREYLYIFGTAMPELLKKKRIETGKLTDGSVDDEVVDPVFEVPLLILDTKKVKLHLRDANFDSGPVLPGASIGGSKKERYMDGVDKKQHDM
jgi:hypothetical protein